ncbi:Sporulation-specific protein spo7 [Pleurostoma richardsiae]|uniref:Sporulation-specific protein spo7 n=1 Tax=Pleurostoma richardsiae TaxID=41990 RepID=A0AA38RRC9_9PEZI|nr:Sporulation-specific protein spo7 [Pleurostoma richardsiae]
MADSIDSIVKGTGHLSSAENVAKTSGTSGVTPTSGKPGDPLSHTPSSPSMIYLNLLILEASLRAQYLELRARRRHHTFFLTLLSLWVLGFGYALFLAPREDGRGVGGSVYWVVEVTEKVCFMGGIITAILVWGTGIWERGMRWPRRWFGVSNRGLRGFNCKLVVIKRPWWAEALSTVGFFLTYGLFSNSTGSSYRYVEPSVLHEVERELNLSRHGHQPLPIVSEDEERGGHEEDLAPGGDYVKLLLLAKPFSPNFRENWELYRTEYWERENERRALIRAKLHERDRRLRRQYGGWLWWLPWREQVALQAASAEKHHHMLEKGHHMRHSVVEKEHRRNRSSSVRRGSMSTSGSSRTPTPTIEVEEGPGVGVARRASTASNASDKRRKKLSTSATRPSKRPGVESRSVTPEIPSPLAKESSFSSVGSEGGR